MTMFAVFEADGDLPITSLKTVTLVGMGSYCAELAWAYAVLSWLFSITPTVSHASDVEASGRGHVSHKQKGTFSTSWCSRFIIQKLNS